MVTVVGRVETGRWSLNCDGCNEYVIISMFSFFFSKQGFACLPDPLVPYPYKSTVFSAFSHSLDDYNSLLPTEIIVKPTTMLKKNYSLAFGLQLLRQVVKLPPKINVWVHAHAQWTVQSINPVNPADLKTTCHYFIDQNMCTACWQQLCTVQRSIVLF